MDKILLFDDRLQVRVSLEEKFKEHDIEVFACANIDEACDTWEKNKDELDAIILDVMMPTYGLSSEHRMATNKGQLTGWIWLWHELNLDKEDVHPAADKFIVIYSAYLDALDMYLKNKLENDLEKRFANSVKRIRKGDNENEASLIKLILQHMNNKKFDIK